MFTSLRQCRSWLAEVDARMSTLATAIFPAHSPWSHYMWNRSDVALIPASNDSAWTFGYTKHRQRPPEPSH